MNEVLLADLIANILDSKKISGVHGSYQIEAYSENDKLIIFVDAEEEDEHYEFTAIIEDSMV